MNKNAFARSVRIKLFFGWQEDCGCSWAAFFAKRRREKVLSNVGYLDVAPAILLLQNCVTVLIRKVRKLFRAPLRRQDVYCGDLGRTICFGWS